jgi:hypothetical protein
MKKAKLTLFVIFSFAAFGSIIASNVNDKRGGRIYVATTLNAPCTIIVLNRTISTKGVATYASTLYNAPCPLTLTTFLQ